MVEFGDTMMVLIRTGHIGAAIVWLGLLYFMVFLRPRILGGLPEETRRQVMPHLARWIGPWIAWASTLTIVFGIFLYLERGRILGFGNIGWTLQLGVLLAFLIYALGLAFVFPVSHKTAKILQGGKPPEPKAIARAQRVATANAHISFVIVLLMVLHARLGL